MLAKPVGNECTVEEGLFTLPTSLSYQRGNSPSHGSNWISVWIFSSLGWQGGNALSMFSLAKGPHSTSPHNKAEL